MNIVIFCHPAFLKSQSMPRFAHMLRDAYESLGHQVALWSPLAKVYNCVPQGKFSKWAGYVDQYILFPFWVRKQIKQQTNDTLYVFADQALGPWVPLVKNKPHVVHVHDLLALRSALGEIPENPTGFTGKIYQRYIRWGFQQAKYFISVSKKTQYDLHRLSKASADHSVVVYNGMNYPYKPIESIEAGLLLQQLSLPSSLDKGFLLMVGGCQWYKNVKGIFRLYAEYAKSVEVPLPLIAVSPKPSVETSQLLAELPLKCKVFFVQNISNQMLNALYANAKALIFPSLAEGFGWPIVESQAAGGLVVTTDDAPMNEIAGPSAYLLPLLKPNDDVNVWASSGACMLKDLLALSHEARHEKTLHGVNWAQKFTAEHAINEYLAYYSQVLTNFKIIQR